MSLEKLTARERALLIATQAGLPCVVDPFCTVAAHLGWRENEVIDTFSALMARGVVRRLGIAVNHYALGYRANAMCVWDVADAAVDAVGSWLAATGAVSHCYRRPRHLPHWRFNLFAMLHGRTQDEVEAQRARLIEACHQRFPQALTAHDALYSTRILKKAAFACAQQRSRNTAPRSPKCFAFPLSLLNSSNRHPFGSAVACRDRS
ncbi:siroheme decarboxylase subunit beta [Hydrogenophilus thermoluteolus]|uniref:siroheme decarboxylase subunit beta n=1 Tax=Hydrogenophilus thermoluteolus TaxID=297 RepID=UPI003F661C13